jgi:glutaredoxin
LPQLTGRTSVPNIWIGGKNVGGCNDGPGIVTLNGEGKLVPLLSTAGAL